MTYIAKKRVNGKQYYYVGKSVRMPDGRVVSLQRIIPNPKEAKEKYEGELERMEKKAFADYAVKHFVTNNVFTEEQLRKIEEMKVEYSNLLRSMKKEDKKDLFDRFTANFTYESDAIEGNSLTLKDVEIVMFENKVPKNADLREVYETKNSRKVLDRVLKKKFGVSEADTKKMHKMLMENIDTRTGYKKFPNIILGSTMKTAKPEEMEKEMKKLFSWYEKNEKGMSPVMLAAHLHGKFEKIHPFADGNGRVGRWLVATVLVNHGYPPLLIRKSQRDSYRKTLADYDRGHADNLERFFLDKYKKTYRRFFKEYHRYL